MSLSLNIDTAIETASVCLAKDDMSIGLKVNPSQKDSAAWLHVAIKELLYQTGFSMQALDAIAVTEGPGSYTGLRVGMATAKGLCYVLGKPLIVVNTLLTMANTAASGYDADLFCPMIDARRMEVFTAVYDKGMNIVLPPTNVILNELSFNGLPEGRLLCFGNGSEKFQKITKHKYASFARIEVNAASMVPLTYRRVIERNFTNLAYSEPYYGKDFHSTAH
ncbi:MAG: tRNA (adenosine(37)-N6)-threonylcarbamoyltransferase complex dimerization subunit type 1 TsaB [Flavisolibacter sp.]